MIRYPGSSFGRAFDNRSGDRAACEFGCKPARESGREAACEPGLKPAGKPASKRAAIYALAAVATLSLLAGCGSGLMPGGSSNNNLSPQQRQYAATADQYKEAIAEKVMQSNPGRASRELQPMLRSVVVVSFTIDRDGRVLHSSVYRTNGDDEVEAAAISSLRRAAPLPVPPTALLDRAGRVDLMESWLFNTDGRFQLRSLASGQ
jgi:periplasmic protein TonB